MKRSALVLQDLSCFTKASINISLPILESNNIDTAILPLSLLATQSDGFDDFFIKDLGNECEKVLNRFLSLGFHFDGILSSYIANYEQYCLVKKVFESFDSLIVVDPVLGDDLKLYQGFDKENIKIIKSLIPYGDVITPNITEACLLTDYELKESYTKEDIEKIVTILSSLTKAKIVITSVNIEKDKLANVIYDDEIKYISFDKVDASYPGSGDLFSSLLLSFLLNNESLYSSVRRAGSITSECIKYTYESKRERRLGLDIIKALRSN